MENLAYYYYYKLHGDVTWSFNKDYNNPLHKTEGLEAQQLAAKNTQSSPAQVQPTKT